jgi:hypothetical protein
MHMGGNMSYFAKSGAMNNAVSIVMAALESGSIKLPGANKLSPDPVENAAADAQYLNELLNSLAKNLTIDEHVNDK